MAMLGLAEGLLSSQRTDFSCLHKNIILVCYQLLTLPQKLLGHGQLRVSYANADQVGKFHIRFLLAADRTGNTLAAGL